MTHEKASSILFAIFLIAAAFVFLALAYSFGYRNGQREERRGRVMFDVVNTVSLYRAAERGDLGRLKGKLGFLVYVSVDTYEGLYGGKSSPTLPLQHSWLLAGLSPAK